MSCAGGPAGTTPPAADAALVPAVVPTGAAAVGTAGVRAVDHAEEQAEEHMVARAEGLELCEILSSGRGSRTWLAKEHRSREKFTVTFPCGRGTDGGRAQQRALEHLAEHWVGQVQPSLVPVRAVVGSADTVRGIMTDHVPGMSLAQRLSSGRMTPAELAPVLAGVARALACLHEQGWVHGTLRAQHVILGADGTVWVDGYGHPATNDVATQDGPWSAASWGHHDRVETAAQWVTRTPADDVMALAALGWTALTGRAPGTRDHRVPLTLVCPATPRHLVLLLEAALGDDSGQPPTASEFCSAVNPGPEETTGTPPAPPAVAVARNADRAIPPSTDAPRNPESRLERGDLPRQRGGGATRGAEAQATLLPGRRHLAPAAAAVVVLAVCGWGYLHLGASPSDGPRTAGAASSSSSEPVSEVVSPGSTAPTSPRTALDPRLDAQEAVKRLVAERGKALALGDVAALEAIYPQGSPLGRADRETIDRAARGNRGADEHTALSAISMEVDRILPVGGSPTVDPAGGAAKTYSFYVEVITRGWHGDLPAKAHVEREGTTVRQSLAITAEHTSTGWRLTKVVPVAHRSE